MKGTAGGFRVTGLLDDGRTSNTSLQGFVEGSRYTFATAPLLIVLASPKVRN